MKNILKIINKYKLEMVVILLSIIIVILGIIKHFIIIPLILVVIIDALYFIPNLRKKAVIFMKNLIRKFKNHEKPQHAKTRHHSKNDINKNHIKPDNKKTIINKKKKKKLLKIILLIALAGIILMIALGVIFCIYIVSHAPNFDPNELYVSEPSIVYDKDGKEVAKLGAEQRVILEYDDLPEVLIDAIVATEDSKFFSHKGVDWARFIKASAQQLLGRNVSGASTLTMQVSKNTYTSSEASGIKGIIRKFTDIYISEFKIEPNYTKEQIMEFYVNSYYLGNNSYGVEQAALTYFGKNAKDLNLAESAMIAGLFQAPSLYNPYTNPKRTEKRRQLVLYYMKRHGYINKKEYEIAKKMTVEKIVKPRNTNSDGTVEGVTINEYQSFLDVVVAEIEKNTGDDPYTVPMKIYSTLDTEKQKHINDIMNGVSYDWENDTVQAGIAVTNVDDGSIVAVGGGRNINAAATLNHATQIKKQIGSTAKPLYDYGPAIEYLNWSTGMPDPDEAISYSDGTTINNWNGAYEGYETIRKALVGSRNIPALKAFQANNKSNILEFVKSLGLSPEDPLHEAHAIGGYTGESPLSMAAAYSAFANGGYYTSPYSYTKIVYTKDDKEVENKHEKKQVMKDSTAYMISSMLVDTGQYALGRWANINGLQYAAKTGTTNYDEATKSKLGLPGYAVNDLWVVGYNTEYAIGVWYGYDKNNSKYYNALSSGQHERLFQAVGRKVFTSNNTFKMPGSVSSVTIENECPTPMLPSEYTPDSLKITELFVKGHEPKETSPRFQKLSDVSNLKGSSSNGSVTLSWSAVSIPEINTESYLKNYFKDTFKSSSYLSSFVSGRLGYINNSMGSFGYNIYKQNGNTLTKIGFATNTSYTFKESSNGSQTYVVKTAYSKFPSTEASGKSVSISVTGAASSEKEKDDDDTKTVEPTCPSGYTLDKEDGTCKDSQNPDVTVNPICSTGYTYDTTLKSCKKS